MGNGERCEDNIRLDLFNIDGEGNDLNDTAENNGDTDSLNLQELFADMPSVHDTTRAMHSMSRRSLRRRRSTRSGRGIRGGDTIDRVQSANENEVFDPEEIADILEETDGVASSKMLKSMAAPMRQRKSVRHIQANRKQSVRYQQRRLSWWKYGKLKIAMGWAQFKTKIKDTLSELELWRSPLKEVEGKFGNGVLSYFLFLKSLLFLNILIFLVEFCFVVIPQIFINYNHLLPDPHAFKVLQSRSNCTAEDKSFYENRSPSDHVLDFFTGQGYINTTLMFYSNYHGQVVFDENKLAYDMPLAYMLVGGAYFIVSLLLMVKNLAQGFTESVIESGGFFYSYCNKVFAGWDYCIIKEEAVNLKRNCIYKDFEAELAEEKRLEEMKNRTSCDKFKLYTLRMIISLVVMVLLAGSIYAIIKSVEVSQNPELTQQNNSLETVVRRWASSLTISVLNVVLPFFFEILTSLEKWSPRVELAISLWRAVLLKLASVAVLVITLFTSYSDFDCKQQCWENQVASQMFNLILIDFFITAGITIVAETSRKYVAEYLSCGCGLGQKIGWQEFQIPKNVLDLVYGQSLIWIGTFFAPLIPVIGILKLILMFYIKKISLMYNCKPSSTPYQGARSNYFFTLLLLLTFLLCTVAVGWGLTRITTSCCGPFGNTLCDENKKMLDIVTARIEEWPHVISEILDFLRTSVFVFPLFIIIFLLLYYYHSMTKAHEKMISMLKDQLITEGRDKRFLMDRLVKASLEAKTPTNNAASSRAK